MLDLFLVLLLLLDVRGTFCGRHWMAKNFYSHFWSNYAPQDRSECDLSPDLYGQWVSGVLDAHMIEIGDWLTISLQRRQHPAQYCTRATVGIGAIALTSLRVYEDEDA